jgi:serine/threonine-protein kinase
VLAGLQAAHDLTDDLGTALRIVHRDVSPHNILVGSDGITRLTDFGIAKAEERIADTRDGIVKGKLSYMAPEQPNDSPIDRRADLFSLGTVLWECLTGRRLFPGKTDAEVLQALLNRPIARLRAVDPELPEALDGVLARALDRDPARRWQSAREFSDALEGAVGASEIASYRVVADHVKQVAAPKIIAEHERRRATTRDLPVYRPSAESLRAISAIPSPGRASSPPAPPTQLPSVASADEAPTQMQSAMMPPTMPTARGLVAPPPLPGPSAKLVTAGPEATTVRPPSDHRASGARLLPPLPPLPNATPASPASPVSASPVPSAPAPAPEAGDVDDEALPPTLISSPLLNVAAAAARAADIAPAPEPVFALMPRAMSFAPPPPVAPRQAQRSSRGFGWLVAVVVLLGASLGVVIWKVGVAGETVEYARPVASRPAAPVITPPPLEPAAPPEPPAVAMESAPPPPVEPAVVAPPPPVEPAVVAPPPVVRAPVVRAPVVRAPVVRAPVVRAPVVRAPVVRAPVVVGRAPVAAPAPPPPPVAPAAPSAPQLPTSI